MHSGEPDDLETQFHDFLEDLSSRRSCKPTRLTRAICLRVPFARRKN